MRAGWTLVASILLSACTVSVPFAERWLFSTQGSQLPLASDCERCHEEIYRQWADSPHARAWTSESFVRLTADYSADDCLSCHAPEPLGAEGRISLRTDHRSEGVTCISCHLSRDPSAGRLAMRGPHESIWPLVVHPMVRDPVFRTSDLCGICHQSIFEEWRMSPEPAGERDKRTCQSCHMPFMHRDADSFHPEDSDFAVLVTPGDETSLREHSFSIPSWLWSEIDVSVLAGRPDEPLQVRIANGVPHGVPTGAFGRRELRIRAEWQGGVAERVLHADLGEAIPAGATRVFAFPEIPNEADWTVALERRDPERREFVSVASTSRIHPVASEAGE